MNLDPALGRADRIGSVVIGLGAIAYAFSGNIDETWARTVFSGLGIAFAIGGFCGT